MPYQVSFSAVNRVLNQVTLKTAGPDQYHICTPTIYLEAEVDGDLLGHAVLWEQIGGSLVTLIGGNTLTPYFNETDGTDKIFRVYLDKNTPYEQYDDVAIIKTPSSFMDMGWFPDRQYFSRNAPDPDPVNCDDITPFVSITVPPPTTLHGEELGSVTVVDVAWQHPLTTQYNSYIEQYRVYEDGVEVLRLPDPAIPDAGDGTGPPTDPLEYEGTFATYRIDTHYNINGVESVRPSCDKDFGALVAPSVRAYNDAVDKMSWEPDQQYFSRTNYRNIVNQSESIMSPGAWEPDHQYFRRTNYSNEVNYSDSITANFSWEPDHQYVNITRYDPSGIGSGS